MWDIAAIGFGLIAGVAIIALMNQVQLFFYPVQDGHETSASGAINEIFLTNIFLVGRLISIMTGAFFAGAISRLVRPHLKIIMNVFTGTILILVGIIDLFMFPYPAWFILASILFILPIVFTGDAFVRKLLFQD